LTKPGQTVVEHNVTILGPANLAADAPHHASQLFAKNVTTFLAHLTKDGQFVVNTDDEITRDPRFPEGPNQVALEALGRLRALQAVHDPRGLFLRPIPEIRAADPVATAA